VLTQAALNQGIWRDVFFYSQDGLRLHARDYGSRLNDATPIVCLPGLTRNGRDFHELAMYFANEASRPRRVVCVDYRGRGQSDYDSNWKNYTPEVEMRDVLDLLIACGLRDVAVIGTSRGGILAMVMAAARPAILAGVVLNDVGPEIAAEGLARIKSFAGKMPPVRDWQDAANLMRTMNEHQFPNQTDETWMRFARCVFREKDGKPVPDYDPKLARQLDNVDLSRPLLTLWPQFDALKAVPTMVIRGENSDLLEPATVGAMETHHPDLESLEVADAGHAPFLDDTPTLKRIAAFLAKLDH